MIYASSIPLCFTCQWLELFAISKNFIHPAWNSVTTTVVVESWTILIFNYSVEKHDHSYLAHLMFIIIHTSKRALIMADQRWDVFAFYSPSYRHTDVYVCHRKAHGRWQKHTASVSYVCIAEHRVGCVVATKLPADTGLGPVQGWGLQNQFSPFRYLPNFFEWSKHCLPLRYQVHIWQVSP